MPSTPVRRSLIASSTGPIVLEQREGQTISKRSRAGRGRRYDQQLCFDFMSPEKVDEAAILLLHTLFDYGRLQPHRPSKSRHVTSCTLESKPAQLLAHAAGSRRLHLGYRVRVLACAIKTACRHALFMREMSHTCSEYCDCFAMSKSSMLFNFVCSKTSLFDLYLVILKLLFAFKTIVLEGQVL